jgi:uncharacterized protein with PIN domain
VVLDTSALLAILQDEPERRRFNEAIEIADSRRISAATFVEASIVIESRNGAAGLQVLDRFIERAAIEAPRLRRLFFLRIVPACSPSRCFSRETISVSAT